MQVLRLLHNLGRPIASGNSHIRRRFATADVSLVKGSKFEGRGFGPGFNSGVPCRLLDVEFDGISVAEGITGGLSNRVVVNGTIPGS